MKEKFPFIWLFLNIMSLKFLANKVSNYHKYNNGKLVLDQGLY